MEPPDRCAEITNSFTVDEAKARIGASVVPIAGVEEIPLWQAHRRVLATGLAATMDIPPFPNSAMDGYALRHADIAGQAPGLLTIIGTSFAGKPYVGRVGPGECVRIFTGAAMPEGADTVIMQEDIIREAGHIRLVATPAPFANVRPVGDEIHCGEGLLERGKALQAADLGLLASAGFAKLTVTRRLRVAFFSTGDELRPVGEPLGHGQIHDSNRYLLHGLLDNPAIEGIDMGVVPDDADAVKHALLAASCQADAVITTGGVSVGDADFVTSCIAELGRVEFWKVAVKPGKPFAFGRIGSAWLFGLAGNPVAVLVTFRQLVRPALLQMIGAQPKSALRLHAICRSTLKKSPGRVEFQRGHFEADGAGGLAVTGYAGQGSHQLQGMSRANCFIVLGTGNAGVKPGDRVEIEPFLDEIL
jgi:molybdopterin molybdotransferase